MRLTADVLAKWLVCTQKPVKLLKLNFQSPVKSRSLMLHDKAVTQLILHVRNIDFHVYMKQSLNACLIPLSSDFLSRWAQNVGTHYTKSRNSYTSGHAEANRKHSAGEMVEGVQISDKNTEAGRNNASHLANIS